MWCEASWGGEEGRIPATGVIARPSIQNAHRHPSALPEYMSHMVLWSSQQGGGAIAIPRDHSTVAVAGCITKDDHGKVNAQIQPLPSQAQVRAMTTDESAYQAQTLVFSGAWSVMYTGPIACSAASPTPLGHTRMSFMRCDSILWGTSGHGQR